MTAATFVLRLSAIGDCVIACRSVRRLVEAKYDPVFVTSPMCFDVAAAVPELNRIALFDAKGELLFYSRSKVGIGRACFEKAERETFLAGMTSASFIDLHCTSRSRAAARALKKFVACKVQNFEVEKRTFYRFFLVFLAFFCFGQTRRQNALRASDVTRVANLQERLLKIFFAQQKLEWRESVGCYFNVDVDVDAKVVARNSVVLAPGASGFLKMWPKEHWRRLVQKILRETNFNIVLCGGKDESWIGEFLQFESAERVFNFIGKTSLPETFALIRRASYVVSCDSFAIHVAAALNKPASVIFGGTTPLFGFWPDSAAIQVHYANFGCSPCTRHGGGDCRFRNLKCLQSIKSEDVFAALTKG